MARELIKSHKELVVCQMAFDAAMKLFELSKSFPVEEQYSLTDQIRRSSRSVCDNSHLLPCSHASLLPCSPAPMPLCSSAALLWGWTC
ncbi:four helix bundle protein [Nostoc flagelliforme FACHB-838]|uniref:Four helix bundle protein n=1 Tax=Nostoc flagelliforme FACHB-838 TaxID=2692904 RepID=A0ABR8DUI0_9NOSO|nr:four helix bundle protein [Nostoc flagelliforme FACHB-838]